MRKTLWCTSLAFTLAFIAGCGGGQRQQLITVTVSPQSAVVAAGSSVQFTAIVTGDSSGVTWSVNGAAGGNSSVGTFDASGKYTTAAVTQNSTATVTATSKRDTTKSASASVTIKNWRARSEIRSWRESRFKGIEAIYAEYQKTRAHRFFCSQS
jgi:hypothetical protein